MIDAAAQGLPIPSIHRGVFHGGFNTSWQSLNVRQYLNGYELDVFHVDLLFDATNDLLNAVSNNTRRLSSFDDFTLLNMYQLAIVLCIREMVLMDWNGSII